MFVGVGDLFVLFLCLGIRAYIIPSMAGVLDILRVRTPSNIFLFLDMRYDTIKFNRSVFDQVLSYYDLSCLKSFSFSLVSP
ncbi:hypothetical protein F5Y03DRAFT_224050 [Xylaria venustula]|nr:hypothetical protein F5Y03DRAFT_224050 [Xylaria venustula]